MVALITHTHTHTHTHAHTDHDRLLNRQEVLNRTTDSAKSSKQRVQNYLKVKRDYFDQRSEVERLRMRTALLKQRLLEQEKIEREGIINFLRWFKKIPLYLVFNMMVCL